ncbi:MAG: OmpA family protein [Bacteroidia bacterium]|nr:OmpA family protein [Bacteroidia bacterium]MDW8346758.1 OmpA family protein [Bacteroidia bacterium]
MKIEKKVSLLYFFVIICYAGCAQQDNILWANEVLGYSSQHYENKRYAAREVIGKPNSMLPGGVLSATAWYPYTRKAEEYVWVRFSKIIKAKQIIVCQNYNAGGIIRIEVFDEKLKPYTLLERNPLPEPIKAGETSQYTVPVDVPAIHSVKIILQGNIKKYDFQQIDAIGITENPTLTYQPKIDLIENIKFPSLPEKLDENINSPYGEDDPIVSADGKILFINRHNHPQNINGEEDHSDIWMSEIQPDGKWGPLKNMGTIVNKIESVWPCGALPDNNTILVGTHYYDIMKQRNATAPAFCYRKKNGWSAPEKVNIPNCYATGNSTLDYGIAPNGKAIFMAFERENSYGQTDIFVSLLQSDGTWTEPINIGRTVNTAGRESTPFMAADNVTLYFCSDGRNGYGGTDIYMTRRLDNSWTKWSEPLNLGPIINTPKDDSEYSLTASGDYAYYVISQDGSFKGKDIYRIKLNEAVKPKPTCLVFGKTLNAKTKEPIEAQIFYETLGTDEKDTIKESGIARSNPNTGSYKISLRGGKLYGFRAEAKGYIPVDENLSLVDLTEFKEIEKNLYLVPIEVGQTISLNNIFFSPNSAKLLPSSYPEIDRVAQFLKDNPQIKIEIHGHTDNGVAGTTESYLLQLSDERAKSVADAIIKRGVKSNQVKYKGFGSSKPIADNNTAEGRQKNRRVEFIIVEK